MGAACPALLLSPRLSAPPPPASSLHQFSRGTPALPCHSPPCHRHGAQHSWSKGGAAVPRPEPSCVWSQEPWEEGPPASPPGPAQPAQGLAGSVLTRRGWLYFLLHSLAHNAGGMSPSAHPEFPFPSLGHLTLLFSLRGVSQPPAAVSWSVGEPPTQQKPTGDTAFTLTFIEQGWAQPWDKSSHHSHSRRCRPGRDRGQPGHSDLEARLPGASLALPPSRV